MAEALNGQTKPPWWILLPEKGSIALREIPFSPEKRCVRITGSIAGRSLSKIEGVVLGNPGKKDVSLLTKKGFSWCYAFAVIPSLKSPVWCISTENKQVSGTGLDLYTPQRWYGRMAKHLVRILNLHRMRHFGFPARLLIALRHPPALLTPCGEDSGPGEIFFSFSQGAEGPFRKTTIQAVRKNGIPVLYIKAAETKKAGGRIENEARALSLLNSNPALTGHVPGLLFSGDREGRRLLVQSVVQGTSGPHSPDKLLFSFLAKLVGDQRVPLESLPFWQARVKDLPVPLGFENLRAKIKTRLTNALIPKTIMHGDFAPWNVLVNKGQVRVIDWESCEPEGLPFFDIFHYVLRYGFLVGHWPPQRTLSRIRTLINSVLFREYLKKTGMDKKTAWVFLELYLLVSLADEDVMLDKGFRDQHIALLKVMAALSSPGPKTDRQ
ncbi:MAG: aminoglycoside phosphotransferase family protein [Desulfobacterales bacterium]|nr:aminoglycoside phosphotransferase family protein [Desulfobacterales bacterium]